MLYVVSCVEAQVTKTQAKEIIIDNGRHLHYHLQHPQVLTLKSLILFFFFILLVHIFHLVLFCEELCMFCYTCVCLNIIMYVEKKMEMKNSLKYKNLQKYATKYIHIYNMKYYKMEA